MVVDEDYHGSWTHIFSQTLSRTKNSSMVKSCQFHVSHLQTVFGASVWVTILEIHQNLWRGKAGAHRLPRNIDCLCSRFSRISACVRTEVQNCYISTALCAMLTRDKCYEYYHCLKYSG